MKNYIKKLFKKRVPSKDELYISDIINTYLDDSSVQKLANPLKGDYYMIDLKNEVSVRLSFGKVEIANHKFLYRKNISSTFSEELIAKMINKIAEDINQTKEKLFRNEIDLLRDILKKLKKDVGNN